jgi:hypothetical protein
MEFEFEELSIIPGEETVGKFWQADSGWLRSIAVDAELPTLIAEADPDQDPDEPGPMRLAMLCLVQIMVLLAGDVATEIHRGRCDAADTAYDLRTAVDLADYLVSSNEECEALLNWLGQKTRTLLARPHTKRLTVAVAEALLERQRLSFDEFRAIVHPPLE